MKKTKITLFAILGAILIIGGYFYVQHLSKKAPTPEFKSYEYKELGTGWKKTLYDDGSVVLESNDWKEHEDNSGDICRTTYIDTGAKISIFADTGTEVYRHTGEGGGVDVGVTKTEKILVDGVEGIYHEYQEFCTAQGQSIDVHLIKDGMSYHISMSYNPDNFKNSKEIFMNFVNSFKFKD